MVGLCPGESTWFSGTLFMTAWSSLSSIDCFVHYLTVNLSTVLLTLDNTSIDIIEIAGHIHYMYRCIISHLETTSIVSVEVHCINTIRSLYYCPKAEYYSVTLLLP